MQDLATEGVDGRLAQDDGLGGGDGDGEEATVFAGTRSQSTPGPGGGAAQFGTDGGGRRIAQQEDRVGVGIGVEDSRFTERQEQRARQSSFDDEVTFDARPVVRGRRGEGQYPGGGHGGWLSRGGNAKTSFQPFQRLAKADLAHVHDQIDGAAAPDVYVPVDELGAGDGKHATGAVPLGRVMRIGSRLQRRQDPG